MNNNTSLTDRLPESYEERLALLNIIIKMSVERLGKESTKRDILKEPYGRPVPPTPLLTEEELIRKGGFSANPTDDVPIFSYEYGFNPLTYLGDLIKWSHPDSVAARNDLKLQSQQRLEFRAKHAMRQMKTALTMRHTVNTTRSGILWGPFVSPSFTNKTEVICVVRALRDGELIAQLSRTKNFKEIDIEIITPVVKAEIPAKFVISNLDEGSHYFIRCCLKDAKYQDPNFPPKPVEMEEPEKKLGQSRMSVREMKENEKKAAEKPNSENEHSHLPLHLRPTARFTGVETNVFQFGEFWTFMAEDAEESDEEDSLGDVAGGDDESYGEEDVNGLYVEPLLLMSVGISSVHHKSKSVLEQRAKETAEPPPAPAPATAEHVASPVSSTSKLLNRGSTREKRSSAGTGPMVVSKVPLSCPDARYLITDSIDGPLALSGEFTPQLTDHILNTLCGHGDAEEARRKKIPQTPVYSCLIGDVFSSSIIAAEESSSLGVYGTLMDSLFKLSVQSGVFCNTLSIFRKTAFLLGWNDGSVGAKSGLRAEEVLYKQYAHDLRRHQRKYKLDKKGNPLSKEVGNPASQAAIPPAPVLMRPPLSSSLETLLNSFGVQLRDDPSASARLMYRRIMLGSICELIVLDSRNGYLGQEQSKWLTATLEASTSPWKIIISGCPLGMRAAVPFTEYEIVNKITDTMNIIDETRNAADGFVEEATEQEEDEEDVDTTANTNPPPPEYDFLGRLITTPVATTAAAAVQGRIDKQSERDARKAAKHAEELKDLEKHNLVSILRGLKMNFDQQNDPLAHNASAEEEEGEHAEGGDEATGGPVGGLGVGEAGFANESGVLPSMAAATGADAEADAETNYLYDCAQQDELHDPNLRVSSGIILLTSGLDVPYIAAYDLKNEGKLKGSAGAGTGYLVEIGVGTMTITTEEQKRAENMISKTVSSIGGVVDGIGSDIDGSPTRTAPAIRRTSSSTGMTAPHSASSTDGRGPSSSSSNQGPFSPKASEVNLIPVQSLGSMPSLPGTAASGGNVISSSFDDMASSPIANANAAHGRQSSSSPCNPEHVQVNMDIPYGIQVVDTMLDVDIKLLHGTFMNDFHYYPENDPITFHEAMKSDVTEMTEKAKSLGSLRSRNSSICSVTMLENIALVKDANAPPQMPPAGTAAAALVGNNDTGAVVGSPKSGPAAVGVGDGGSGSDDAKEATDADFVPVNVLNAPDAVEANAALAKQMLTASMVNTIPPSNTYTGPTSCGLYVHSNGTITVSINNLKTNESVASVDMISLAVLPLSEPTSP